MFYDMTLIHWKPEQQNIWWLSYNEGGVVIMSHIYLDP